MRRFESADHRPEGKITPGPGQILGSTALPGRGKGTPRAKESSGPLLAIDEGLATMIYGCRGAMAEHMVELRRIRTDEWRVFKTLRLAALEHGGEQFGQSYAEVSLLSDEKWQEDTAKAAESNEFYVILAFDETRPVGMSACVRREDFGKMIMVWVDPQYRGSGIGRLLVDRTMTEAGAPSYKLTVVEGNTPAIRTYEQLGFTPTGFAYTNSKGLREMEMIL